MDEKELLNVNEMLDHDNRELKDEAMRLRPLARLAAVIARMEGENAHLHSDLTQTDRDLEDTVVLCRRLRLELESGTQKKRTVFRAVAWAMAGVSAAWLMGWRHRKPDVIKQDGPGGGGGTGHG